MFPANPLPSNILSFLIKLTIILLAIFLYVRLAGPIPFSVSSTSKTDAFSVTGVGKASIKPNIVSLTAGVSTSGASVKAVQDQMNLNINRVTEAVKNAGISEADIQTQNYNVNPIYDYDSGTQKITGYTANTNIIIKIKDVAKANQILDIVTESGANNVGGINFDNEDNTEAQNEARKKAVENAKKKAQEAARAAGFSLGKIVNYQESFNGEPPILYDRDLALPQAGGGSATNVEPGTNEVIVNVTLSFEVR